VAECGRYHHAGRVNKDAREESSDLDRGLKLIVSIISQEERDVTCSAMPLSRSSTRRGSIEAET
jgi:hypothetical protein